jgi:tetratricopeptide (TPR) repeat protein
MNYIIFALTLVIISISIMILKSLRIPMSIRKAEERIAEGDYSGASEIVKVVLNKKKDYPPARYIKARLLIQQSQYILAISELNSILTLPDFSKYINELEIHYHLAEHYNITKNYQKEIEEYKAILSFNPDDIKANHRLGHAFYQLKSYKNARDYLLKTVVLDPGASDTFLPLGVSCFKVSDYQKAEQYLLRAFELKKDSESQFYLGSIYKMKKDYENARVMLENSRNDRRFLTGSLYMLAEMAFEKEDYGAAIEYLEKGLNSLKEKDEESLAYRYLLAECYENENKIKEAVHHWSKIEVENPNYRSTKIKLEAYRAILENNNLMQFFQTSLEELQPYIRDMIAGLNFNIVSADRLSMNEYLYKTYNIKRINDPPMLVCFNKTTREISEGQIIDFYKRINNEKCKGGIYITTSKFSLRAKSNASSKMIDLYDSDFVSKAMEKINARKKVQK